MRYLILKRTILGILCCVYGISSLAQRENVWVFGKNAGLDFNMGSPVSVKTNLSSTEACASICDEKGQLLFYTDGSKVWDKNGDSMHNGTDLTPIVLNGNLSGYSPTESTSQGAAIVPFINDKYQYYIFSLTQWGSHENFSKLFYSVVDLRLNNGTGDVVPGRKGVLMDSNLTEAMTSIVGDRCNIWLLVGTQQRDNKHEIKAYEITASGINPNPVVSNGFPSYYGTEYYSTGQFAVTPGRNRIALTKSTGAGGVNGLAIFDFDPVSGRATNYQQLSANSGGYGVCFSPDGTKLYFNSLSSSGLCQYDLSSNSIREIIDSKTPLNVSSAGPLITLKMGPDNKIYFRGSPPKQSLSRINYPDSLSSACIPEDDAISLIQGTFIYLGLPGIVPVSFQLHDTFYTSQSLSAPCFTNTTNWHIGALEMATGWDYQWNTGATAPDIRPDTPGSYWVSYRTPPCNFHTDTFHISFPNGVLPDITIDTACFYTANGNAYAATYPGDTVRYHYIWQNQAGDTLSGADTLKNVYGGNYRLYVRTANCDTNFSIYIPEVDYRVSFHVDSIICTGSEIILNNQSDSHFKQFHWDFGDAESADVFSPTHIYTHTGTYKVALTGSGSICRDSVFQIIEVDPRFSSKFLAQPDSICMGMPITFYTQTHYSAVNLHWQFGDGEGVTTGNESMLQHAYQAAGLMPVTLNTQFRVCPDTSFSDTLHVFPVPVINLAQDSELCLDGHPIILQNLEVLPGGNYHYQWNTGATTERLQVVEAGQYSLTISDRVAGCSATESVTVTKDCHINIPNAFTPDGDGLNDYFFPRQLLSNGLSHFRMQILNRWGQLLFETNSVSGRGWDGTYNGKALPQGAYMYKIAVKLENGKTQSYHGNVTLIR